MLMLVMLMTSCSYYKKLDYTLFQPHLIESDVELLKDEAANGNTDAKRAIMLYGGKYFPKEQRESYRKELLEKGDFQAVALMRRMEIKEIIDVAYPSKAMLHWMEYGAEKGNVDWMYNLALYHLSEKHFNPELAEKLITQAADSLHAFSRMRLRMWRNCNTVFDRGVLSFSQVWNRDMRQESFLCRFSNAAFNASYGFMNDCFSKLFTNIWWQCLLLMAFMIIILIVAILWATTLRPTHRRAILTSTLYGLFNGYVWYYMSTFFAGVEGVINISNAIGRFSRQEGTFGWTSDACVYLTWLWAALLLYFFVSGLLELRKAGELNVKSAAKYVFTFLFFNVIFYVMFSTIGVFAKIFYLIMIVLIISFFFQSSGSGNSDGRNHLLESLKDHERAMKEHQEDLDRQRMNDINNKLWGR